MTIKNKAKRELYKKRVQAQKDKKARCLLIQESQVLGSFIYLNTWINIQDPEKQPTPAETAALSASRSLYNTAATAQKK